MLQHSTYEQIPNNLGHIAKSSEEDLNQVSTARYITTEIASGGSVGSIGQLDTVRTVLTTNGRIINQNLVVLTDSKVQCDVEMQSIPAN